MPLHVGVGVGVGAWRRRLAQGAVLAALAAGELTAAAQPPPAPAPDQAAQDRRTALYGEGVNAATAGRWTEARDKFRAVVAIRSSPKVLFSLAQAEEQLGQVATASADYGRALEGARATPGESEVVAAADQAQRALAPRVPHVRVVVSGSTAPPTATLDDQPIAVGTVIALDPGAHRVVVSATGMRQATASVTVVAGQQLDVPVRLASNDSAPAGADAAALPATPAAPPAAESPQPAAGSPLPWRTIGLVTAGVGVVALAVGTVFGVVAKSKNDQSKSGCDSNNNCTTSAAATRNDALSAANTATVAFVVGAVLAAGGVTLWLLAPSAGGDQGVGVTPVALGAGGGVVVTGGW
jgi:hypothetical protein